MEKIKINKEAARSIIDNNRLVSYKVLVHEKTDGAKPWIRGLGGAPLVVIYSFKNENGMGFSVRMDHIKEEYFLRCYDIADVTIN